MNDGSSSPISTAATPDFVDLRSDTVTRPTAAMLAAMMTATVGDDVYGEDQAVTALEARVAQLLGLECALFVPSGTMANQLAIAVHTRPGDSAITEAESHCVRFEAGGAAALSGVQFEQVARSERLSDGALRRLFKSDGLHESPTTLLVVENTHNMGGGRVLAPAELARILRQAKTLGLAAHCDGARLWNAAAALGVSERELAAGFDTVSVCFSKGLGAPVGSALAGSAAHIARARKLRKRWGGGMRQAGFLAAAALYAIDHHRERLTQDHRRAAAFAGALAELARAGRPVETAYPEPGTNLVYFRIGDGGDGAYASRLAEQGVRISQIGDGWLRAVLHLDVDDDGLARALDRVTRLIREI